MTSRLGDPGAAVLHYRRVLPEGYLCPDPEHRVDSLYQNPAISESEVILREHFSARSDVFVDTGGFVFYDTSDLNRRVRPDLYIAFGVDPPAIYGRNGFVIEEVGKPPDFVLEVGSPSTHEVDTATKPLLYARIGVGEYWRFDPLDGENYGYALAADILVEGTYQALPVTLEADGMTWGYSPILDLNLCAQGDRLIFHDPRTDRYLMNLPEAKAALEAANAEADRLREELRRLRGD